MKAKKGTTKLADAFFERLLRDPETKLLYEEEHAKTKIAASVRAARAKAKLTQTQLAKKLVRPKV